MDECKAPRYERIPVPDHFQLLDRPELGKGVVQSCFIDIGLQPTHYQVVGLFLCKEATSNVSKGFKSELVVTELVNRGARYTCAHKYLSSRYGLKRDFLRAEPVGNQQRYRGPVSNDQDNHYSSNRQSLLKQQKIRAQKLFLGSLSCTLRS